MGKDVRDMLETTREEYESLWRDRTLRAFEIINSIASEVSERWGVLMKINFPPGQERPVAARIGRRNVSILVDKNRKKFETITEADIKRAIHLLHPQSFDLARFCHEGFRANLSTGRIDWLPV